MRNPRDTMQKRVVGLSVSIASVLALREIVARSREADLSGQVALITGGSRGLGLAIARELAGQECRLAICARDAAELERAAADLRASGAEVLTVVCDVGVEQDVTAMVEQVTAHYGHIDLLFTVAGEIQVSQSQDLELEDFRRAMDVMFWGALYPIHAVVPGMRARQYGRIALITSIGGVISVPHLLSYTAAKFAATGLGEGLSAELSRDGITVTTFVPGLMRTGSHIHARFKGSDTQQRGDYTWFSLGAATPVAASAARAARNVVQAVKRGEAERIFPFQFGLASRFHGVAPATTVRLMRVANTLMPGNDTPPGETTTRPGSVVETELDSSLHRAATTLGRKAEAEFNQRPGPSSTQSA